MTIYALFGDDIRVMATLKEADPVFDVLTVTTMVVFVVEITLSVIGKDDYFLSFFFYLDIISTVMLVLDLTVLLEALSGGGEESGAASVGTADVVRVGRVVRVLRLVRIIKLYKSLYEFRQFQKKKEEMQKMSKKATRILRLFDICSNLFLLLKNDLRNVLMTRCFSRL
jgi:hypothetical protein